MLKKSWLLLLCLVICLSSGQILAGVIPSSAEIEQTLNEVYEKYKDVHEGKNADYIPALAKVDPKLFAIAIVTVDGDVISVGDDATAFPIESISKPFAYLLALHDNGEATITSKVGLNATGQRFNSIAALKDAPDHKQNPLVNAGAIQITSFIKGPSSKVKWNRMLNFVNKLSDGKLHLGKTVYDSEMATNQHNREIAELLDSYHMLASEPLDAVERYTKACSIMATAPQLALMGATLANYGTHPITHQQLISPLFVRDALSEMVVNGLYENSGAWFWTVGLPAKSGVGGAILAIVPNQMAIVVFSPPLDHTGNSYKAQAVIKELANRWHLHVLQGQ